MPRLEVEVVAPAAALAGTRGLAAWLTRVGCGRTQGQVTVGLVSDARMRALNRRYRGTDRVTDVLSFSAFAPQALRRGKAPIPILGDIVIAVGRARRQARDAGHPLGDELRLLALHGLLHLAGYDHAGDDGRMARVERALRREGGLGPGLIERAGRRSGGPPARRAR